MVQERPAAKRRYLTLREGMATAAQEQLAAVGQCRSSKQQRGDTTRPKSGAVGVRTYPTTKVRSSSFTSLEQLGRDSSSPRLVKPK